MMVAHAYNPITKVKGADPWGSMASHASLRSKL